VHAHVDVPSRAGSTLEGLCSEPETGPDGLFGGVVEPRDWGLDRMGYQGDRPGVFLRHVSWRCGCQRDGKGGGTGDGVFKFM
jgi:hypothetical protein